jgi:hypothetical protein
LAEQREILKLPKKVPYEVYNIYIQLIKTEDLDIEYDDFLRLMKNKNFKNNK